MDFVVVGLGLGALAILGGVLLLGVIAGRWERAAATANTYEDAAYGAAMAAGRRGAGQALLGAGGALILATIGGLAGSLDDRTGAYLITTTATVAALGLLVWAHRHRTRHPIPPRRARASRPARAPALALAGDARSAAAVALAPDQEAAARDDEPPAVENAAAEGEEAVALAETAPEAAVADSAIAPDGRGEPGAYSFMVDDDVPDPHTRTAPYSFMQDEATPEDDEARRDARSSEDALDERGPGAPGATDSRDLTQVAAIDRDERDDA